MTKLIIFAGPQSSGKTTALKIIKKHFPEVNVLEETNQYNVHSKNHRGAAFVTVEMEREIVETDIKKIRAIDRRLQTAVIETGIFHMLYLERFIGPEAINTYYPKYLEAHEGLNPIIIFLDTVPGKSWIRRKKIYEERIRKSGVTNNSEKQITMQKYKNTISELYPLWLKWYKKLPFVKMLIKNSNKSRPEFEKELLEILNVHLPPTTFRK